MASILDSGTAHVLRRSGIFISRASRSIWIHGATVERFERATDLVRDVRTAHPANRLLLTSNDAEVCRWLRARYPGHAVMPPPWNGPFAGRFLAELDPKILLRLDLDDRLSAGLLRRARAGGVPVVVIGAPPEAFGRVAELVDGFLEPPATIERLLPFFARLPVDPPKETRARRRTRHLAESRLGRWLAGTRAKRRLADWEAIRRRLGTPRTILCLGNGPTSEDPAVVATAHDCLMRVNHRWRERGLLTRPDVVFVGSLSTTLEIPPPCLFGFRNVRKEREVLLRHLFFGRRRDLVEHFTLERLGSPLDDRTWPATPTNGAAMIAAAVMLRPERLVIAGIDLYQDARGIYPGQNVAENEYLRGHQRAVEIEVIAHAIEGFRGELVVLAPNLERALAARRRSAVSSIAILAGDS